MMLSMCVCVCVVCGVSSVWCVLVWVLSVLRVGACVCMVCVVRVGLCVCVRGVCNVCIC